MGIQVLPLRTYLETGLGPDTNSFTRRRNRTEGLGIYHMTSTTLPNGGAGTKIKLLKASSETREDAVIIEFNPGAELNELSINDEQLATTVIKRANGLSKIILDLTNIKIMPSRGIGELMTISKLAKKSHQELIVCNFNDVAGMDWEEVIKRMKLHTLMSFADTLEDALAGKLKGK